MPRGESLYHRYPDYRVDLEPSDRRLRVSVAGRVVAESARTLVVRETRHEPVVYFPRDDVRFEVLDRTDHETFCPFKGRASYWTIRAGDHVEENAVWSYEDPFPEVAGLRDYVAFYRDRVQWEEPAAG